MGYLIFTAVFFQRLTLVKGFESTLSREIVGSKQHRRIHTDVY